MQTSELYRKMASLLDEGTPFVLVSVLEAVGSTPRKGGAKMLVLPDGKTVDTIGGGKVEAQAIADALVALKTGVSRVVEYELRPTGENALGMVCGGAAKVSLDVHSPGSTLLIIGAGHIGQKLAPMAKLLDFRVVVLDERPEFANRARYPEADEVIVGKPGEAADLVRIDPQTHVVIVTHGHLHDKEALRAVAASPAVYVGMIGSKTKVKTVFGELAAEGVPAEALARVRAPIGLDLGGHTPAEVSLSILAQIVAERHGKVESLGTGALSIAATVAAGDGGNGGARDAAAFASTAAPTAAGGS